MELKWTSKALSDLARLFDFLAPVNRTAAANTIQALVAAPKVLRDNPRIGEKLDEFMPQEVRRILVGHYEMRYQLQSSTIYVLRIWHTREERQSPYPVLSRFQSKNGALAPLVVTALRWVQALRRRCGVC